LFAVDILNLIRQGAVEMQSLATSMLQQLVVVSLRSFFIRNLGMILVGKQCTKCRLQHFPAGSSHYIGNCNDWTENSELYCIFDAWKSRSQVAKYRNGLMTIPNRRRSFSSLQLTHRPILLGRETAIEITRTELQNGKL